MKRVVLGLLLVSVGIWVFWPRTRSIPSLSQADRPISQAPRKVQQTSQHRTNTRNRTDVASSHQPNVDEIDAPRFSLLGSVYHDLGSVASARGMLVGPEGNLWITTNASGHFSQENLVRGTYQLHLLERKPFGEELLDARDMHSCLRFFGRRRNTFEIVLDGDRNESLEMTHHGDLLGRVEGDVDAVTLTGLGIFTFVEPGGSFRMVDVPPGFYRIREWTSQGERRYLGRGFRMPPGKDLNLGELQPEATGTLQVAVVGETAVPYNLSITEITEGEVRRPLLRASEVNPQFETVLPAVELEVAIDVDGAYDVSPEQLLVTLPSDDVASVRFEVVPVTYLSLKVKTQSLSPERARLSAQDGNIELELARGEAIDAADSKGWTLYLDDAYLAARGLPEGTWKVELFFTGNGYWSTNVQLQAGKPNAPTPPQKIIR